MVLNLARWVALIVLLLTSIAAAPSRSIAQTKPAAVEQGSPSPRVGESVRLWIPPVTGSFRSLWGNMTIPSASLLQFGGVTDQLRYDLR